MMSVMRFTSGTWEKGEEMTRAPRNRTITLSDKEREDYRHRLLKIDSPILLKQILNRVINQNISEVIDFLSPSPKIANYERLAKEACI